MSDNTKGTLLRKFLKTRAGMILTHSGFIAAVLGIITFYLIGFSPDSFLFEMQKAKTLYDPPAGVFTYYADLNSDGLQEHYTFANDGSQNSMFIVYQTELSAKDQWNFMGSISPLTTGYYTGNYDHDNCLEVACFSVKSNSIYLNIVEPYGDTTHLVKNRFVDTIWTSVLDHAVQVHDTRFCDLNQDGYDELLFSISVGQAFQPRKVYMYDFKADSLWSSPLSGIGASKLEVFDLDHDGHKEIFCETYASNNSTSREISYPDTCSWFMVLDERLNYKVPPVRKGGLFSTTSCLIIEKSGIPTLFALTIGMQNLKGYTHWYLVNPDFSLTASRPFENLSENIAASLINSSSGKEHIFFDVGENELYFTSQGKVTDSIRLKYFKGSVPIYNYRAGISQFEYAIWLDDEQESILFLNRAGKKLGALELDSSDADYRICWTGMENGLHQFLLSGRKHDYWIAVRPNPWQYWQYLILLALMGGFYGFLTFIRFVQSQQLARQENMRKEVMELQLKAVRNQLDPHFTFNALNTLSGLSLTGDKMGVDRFINHFSRLLRTHLQTSDKILIPLKEEIEFVVNYVELQRIRFDNVFHLELDIPKEVDIGSLIPKMLIQTYVENAIKHAFRGLRVTGTGRLLVRITETDNTLSIVIEDNGVGRGNSKVPEFESTGKGLLAIDRIRDAVRQLYGMRIKQEVEDLFGEDGKPAGTRVVMTVEG